MEDKLIVPICLQPDSCDLTPVAYLTVREKRRLKEKAYKVKVWKFVCRDFIPSVGRTLLKTKLAQVLAAFSSYLAQPNKVAIITQIMWGENLLHIWSDHTVTSKLAAP